MCLLLFAMLLPAASCAVRKPGSVPSPQIRATAEPEITAEPAPLLSGVETQSKAVSLVFEGFTDSVTMEAITDVLKMRDVPAVFFVSGISANENREIVQKLAASGFTVGSYGLNGGKHLEGLTPNENAYRFMVAQREIADACGKVPEYVCCNSTVYTEEVLRAVTAAGLKAAVVPSVYLNHKSFQSAEDAALFTQSVIRGSILSIKLGQELEAGEYGEPGQKQDSRPAIDPTPGIRWDWDEEYSPYASVPDIVAWLVDALEDKGYSFLDPEDLQKEAHTFLPKLRILNDEERQELDPAHYDIPVTDMPLYSMEKRAYKEGDLNGAVFVGDAVMIELKDYVAWRRETEPDYMDDARFLAENNLTVDRLLNGESRIGDLSSRLVEMNASSVWLCLGFTKQDAYRRPAYLAEYRRLIGQIVEQNPEIRVVIMSVFPKIDRYPGISNENRFCLNLLLCGMCREYGLAFVDVASAVRDEIGQLREDYCADLTTFGFRPNDTGCEAVLDFIKENYPQ